MSAEFVTGIDIGSFTIKAVVLSHQGKIPKLISLGLIATPAPGMASDADIDLEAVGSAITALLASIKAPTSAVVVALPESKIFSRVIHDFPFLTDEELTSAIKYSAEEFVPLPVDQVNLYWQVIDRSKQANKTRVFVVASPKMTVAKYLKVLKSAKINPMALETNLIAAMRSLIGDNPFAPATLILQLGASSTDFAVVSKGVLMLTRSIATGGVPLTRAISQYLDFETVQAEEYKKVYGMAEDQLEGKIYQVLKPLVDVIVSESERVMQAYESKNPQDRIKRVVLTGGGAKLPGLVVYFANKLGLETQEADPWFSIDKDPALVNKLSMEGANYAIAVGLALRKEA